MINDRSYNSYNDKKIKIDYVELMMQNGCKS